MADRRPDRIAGPLNRAVLSSGDAATLLGRDLRAEVDAIELQQAELQRQAQAGADSQALVLHLRDLGFTPVDVLQLIDIVKADHPATDLARWIDAEPRPDIRKRLMRMLVVVSEGA